MNNYSDIEIKIAKNLLKRGYKWLRRNLSGTLCAYEIEPTEFPKYVVNKVICSDLVPIFESIKCCDDPVSLEAIVHPQILDDAERKYLSAVIKPFRDNVKLIRKADVCDKSYIYIMFANDDDITMFFPYFEKGAMYKGMEPNKRYTLEELGL